MGVENSDFDVRLMIQRTGQRSFGLIFPYLEQLVPFLPTYSAVRVLYLVRVLYPVRIFQSAFYT